MENLNIVLRDDAAVCADMLPLSYTRPVGAMRVGIMTLAEKWQVLLPGAYSWDAHYDYLREKFPLEADPAGEDTITVASEIVATPELAAAIAALAPGCRLVDTEGRFIASRGAEQGTTTEYAGEVVRIRHAYDLFLLAGREIEADFRLITRGRRSQPLSPTNTVVGNPALIFLEPGAKAECAVFNVTGGPIYLGPDSEVMEGVLMRGPVAVGRHSVVNMGAKIYGATTIGPHCKVGGELSNVVMLGFSNKAHDGYLGNAVIGEWCNIGAGTNASNLKNDYTEIKLWNYRTHRFMRTGLIHCGLFMGDHSKAGINCMFNTATVIGVGVNVHGAGFPRNFVASFSEGSVAGYSDVSVNKFFDTAKRMMARRGVTLSDDDKAIFESIYNIADNYK